MNPLVSINNANIGYGNKTILSNITFSVSSNELVFLYGKNGSGKSTLLKAISSQDNVRLSNVIDYSNLIRHSTREQIRQDIVYISQNEDMDLFATIYDYFELPIMLGLVFCKPRNVHAVIEAYFRDNHLFDLFNEKDEKKIFKTRLKDLSFGQKHLISIFSSLFGRENKLLYLFDEPLNFLDYSNSRLVLNKITDIHKKNLEAGIVVCSHCQSITNVSAYYSINEGELVKGKYKPINRGCFGVVDDNGYYV